MEYNQHRRAFNVNITMIDQMLGAIAPHYCLGCEEKGDILCGRCKNDILDEPFLNCLVCDSLSLDTLCATHQMPYDLAWCVSGREGLVGAVVDTYKFQGVRAAHRQLAELLHGALPDLPMQTEVVPIPTTPRNIRIRGYDHMLMIAKELSRLRGWRVSQLLSRRNNQTQHFTKSAVIRRKQAAEFFEVSRDINSAVPYLIIDDIFTTGSTVDSAARCLRRAGAKSVWLAVIARHNN